MEIICQRCGSVNDYRTEMKAHNLVAYCNGCGNYIKNIPYAKPRMPWGKFKDEIIELMDTPEKIRYLHWLRGSDFWSKLSAAYKDAINKRIG